jgi:uncharacterized protein DUF2630
MNDQEILGSIDQMVAEEHQLWDAAEQGGLSAEQATRLSELQVNLDRCWDLLRQRRARREYHQDPNEARLRDAATVEHYQQ